MPSFTKKQIESTYHILAIRGKGFGRLVELCHPWQLFSPNINSGHFSEFGSLHRQKGYVSEAYSTDLESQSLLKFLKKVFREICCHN